ncbi:MAG: hypothetical protein QNJ73_16450 [Gammaproteobacteria bacterium]|nr:hypothetical protein [Gammaproteobacteria bacterium]
MRRAELLLVHAPSADGAPFADWPDDGILLRTCMRQVWLGTAGSVPGVDAPLEAYRGDDAYRFALEVITGLHSGIPGETNIHGQFRRAWQHYRDRAGATPVAAMAPAIHRLLNDASDIRRHYLWGLGGASYGSLLRKLIRPRRGERILLVGYGNLAQSVLPFLQNWPVAVWNHRRLTNPPGQLSRCFAPDEAAAASRWADHVVLTTPPDDRNDARWSRSLRGHNVRTVVHLGHRHESAAKFAVDDVTVLNLDHLFELRQQQAVRRATQLARARRACGERARAAGCLTGALPPGRLANA